MRYLLGLPFRLLAARGRPAYVRFRLSGEPPYRERPRRRSLGLLGGQGRPEPATVTSLEGFRKALELLAKDPKVKGILVELEDLAVPPAKRDVLVKLLGDFRAAGKRVVTWAVSTDNLGYQVMCAADEALLSPAGRLELMGYAAEAVALGEGLGRLGIQAHFFRRGEYKTMPELFTLPDVSNIQRQVLESFLDERYMELLDMVAKGRRRTVEQARAWIDEGPYSAKRALGVGLIDGVCDEADLPARLAGKGAEEKAEDEDEGLEPMPMYLARLPWPPVRWRPLRPRPRLAVVPVSGMIVPGKGGAGVAGPQLAGSDTVVRALRSAGRNRRVKAVVLYVSSSGGSAVASEIILEAVQRVAKKKPVIAFVDRVAASGGYMAALGAKEIWATQHAIVGSIGVFAGKFDTSGLMEKLGVHQTLITRGQNAGIFSSTRGFTEHERALMEAEVEETYQAFLEHVAKARGRTKEEIHALGEGRVYSGTRALAVGLVDRTEGFEEACRRAMELAKVPGRFDLQVYGGEDRRFSLLKLLLGGSHAGTYAFCPTAWNLQGFGEGERFE
ncbi:signal peptide peptidase SppA [Vitiosangium sp. GDMCC 1.1324]|uniref:signal peptide peptidase SppA n=1 Tax=Vitiosangium sp. (strain GDMCC 1.1324) TaxID=2138576 RepID=UPI000D337627|nr:signal peptide peptidase SppA [Vitiosangium sp. GDMCC 1.1324]PTL86004.1 signal peptide peptidase SppA [Vitiosangium sp. GDMCC 1.1324]